MAIITLFIIAFALYALCIGFRGFIGLILVTGAIALILYLSGA